MYSVGSDYFNLFDESFLISLVNDKGDVTSREQALPLIENVISSADAIINLYVGNKEQSLLDNGILKKLSIDLTIYELYKRRMIPIPSEVVDSNTRAYEILKDIASDKVAIKENNLEPINENILTNTRNSDFSLDEY